MAGWIKMPLDTKVGLGTGNIVLDGDPALLFWDLTPKIGSSLIVTPKRHLIARNHVV